ncbi:hypothetical protein KPL71_008192 [Citrus sinensis]|uniref:Uncharacterized protein n=1 Tax=Citrus sinensis TaxID=2711 RepID=A0ACB8M4X7_CITSI|nr:hypothetical protein KPL71_008192 [Citrus sinensis]
MPESSATNQPPPTQTNPSSQKSSNGPWFTFDDLPSHKWRDRLNEMSAWIDLQMLRPGATTQSVLREFATRFTGALRDWFDSLGQYRQLQFVDLPEVSSALAVLHDQFLGDPSAVFEAARRDYLNMKCCSLNAKDLDFHYKRISLLFYKLNGFNEPTLKHIKCHKKKDCSCSSKKKRHFRKFKTPEFSSKPRRSRKPYRFFRKKSSSSREFKRKQSSRCFICKRKGHYAKDCPNKREKSIRLVEHLQATTDYSPAKDELEFYFSEQDEPNDETVFTLQNSSDSDSDQSQVIFHQQSLSLDTTVPIPSIKLQILPSKFQRPIPAFGLIDTGAQRSMLNPHVDHYTHHLSALLKKKPPEWNADHTFAITTLKQIAQNPPPLKLITDGKRILQTDASDESWGAILLEEINGKEHFIAYASGHFSDTQKHYHSVFKEILAVKNGIKKFEYHLIGHHFLIRMDNSAFPNIFHFKGIIIKEEKPDYTDFLFQDSQDPWDTFLPLSQHLHQFPQPTMDEPGPSEPGPSTQSSKRPAQPSKVDKATQTSPQYTPKCTPRDYNCPYPPCRGSHCKHPKLSKTFFQKYPHSGDTDPDETESSSEDEYMNLRSP